MEISQLAKYSSHGEPREFAGLGHSYHEMSVRRHNHQVGLNIELRRGPPQRRQNQQRHEESCKHINRNGAFEPLRQFPNGSDVGHCSILHDHIQARQLAYTPAELLDALEAAQIQRPHLYDIAPRRRTLDVGLGAFALLGIATCQDHLGRIEPDEMPRCLETQSDICACYNDRLPGELLFWFRQAPELVVEEGDEKIAGVIISMRRAD